MFLLATASPPTLSRSVKLLRIMEAREKGERFESALWALLDRVMRDDLRLEVLENRRQGSGLQSGYDIRIRWRAADGRIARWHIECKSQESSLKRDEITPKLEQVIDSAHGLDVWCLACAHAEPTNETDQMLERKRASPSVPFDLVVLSPQQGFIKELFECHGSLFSDLYGEPAPIVEAAERQRRIDAFGLLLGEGTRRGRVKNLPAAWVRLESQALVSPPAASGDARAFLTGLRLANPWDAIARSWAISRPQVTDRLAERIDHMAPGVDGLWLWAAGGEGKTTSLRQLAWRYLAESSGWEVLWLDSLLVEGRPELPTEWLKHRGPQSRSLLIMDGVADTSIGGLLSLEKRLQDEGSRAFLLLASRGATRVRQPSLQRQLKALSKGAAEAEMLPLDDGELAALVDHLEALGMLLAFDPAEALDRLKDLRKSYAAGAPWLLPTLMELIDKDGRGFRAILHDVMVALTGHEDRPALVLLIAASICQTSGTPFREGLVAPLLEGQMLPSEAFDVLAGELASGLGVSPAAVAFTTHAALQFGGPVLVHHDVIAAGFASVAVEDFASSYAEALEKVATSMAGHVRSEVVIPKPLFGILEAVLHELTVNGRYGLAEQFLRAWIALDERQFPAWHRLGTLQSLHLHERPREKEGSGIRALLAAGVESFQRAVAAAEEVLEREDTPEPWRDDTIADVTRQALAGLSTICDRAGARLRDTALLKQGAALAILALATRIEVREEPHSNAVVISSLGHTLIRMGEREGAAAALGVARAIGPGARTESLEKKVEGRSMEVPDEPFSRLADLVLRLEPELAASLSDGKLYKADVALEASFERVVEMLRGWR